MEIKSQGDGRLSGAEGNGGAAGPLHVEAFPYPELMVLCCWKLLIWLEGTYGAAGGKVAVLSNRGDAVGGAVMTPQRKPVLPWLLRIEELRIVESTNDAERNTTTHDSWPYLETGDNCFRVWNRGEAMVLCVVLYGWNQGLFLDWFQAEIIKQKTVIVMDERKCL
ncbi:hypothetical protein POTOM_008348 [Populus tomentosa]|uniref:Uncharacterized protein n=1 Tax=Populus tomentosa TaxID=118781 RepID=A0A8X8ALW6_POPTO|nr:hypothetical protein POTOM_008348 [Populus tomentosa]